MAGPESFHTANAADAVDLVIPQPKVEEILVEEVIDDPQANPALPSSHENEANSGELASITTISTSTPTTSAKPAESGPSLYCPVNGRSHAVLLDFNINKCTVCEADLSAPASIPSGDAQDREHTTPKRNTENETPKRLASPSLSPELRPSRSSRAIRSSRYNGYGRSTSVPSPVKTYGEDLDLNDKTSDNESDDDLSESGDDDDFLTPGKNKNKTRSKSREPKPVETVKQTVHFRDRDGDIVSVEKWKGGRFEMKPPTETEQSDASNLIIEAVIALRGNFARRELPYEEKYDNFLNTNKYTWNYQGTSLQIHSKAIITAINGVVPYLRRVSTTAILKLNEPYALIGNHYSALKKYATNLEASVKNEDSSDSAQDTKNESKTLEHLETLFKWLDDLNYEKQLAEEAERNKRGFCTFRMLWALLKPETTVYMDSQDLPSGYVIESVNVYGAGGKDGESGILTGDNLDNLRYTITVWNLKYDGKFVGRYRTDAIIPYFAGEKAISSLKVVPLDMLDRLGGACTKANLEAWGRMWYGSLRGRQVYYEGPSLSRENRQIEGRAYIDPSPGSSSRSGRRGLDFDRSYDEGSELDFMASSRARRADGVKCPCDQCHGLRVHPPQEDPWRDYDLIDPGKTTSLEQSDGPHEPNHRYLVCDRVVLGLILKTRSWENLDIACCSVPKWNEKALDTLVMPPERKGLVQALVMKFKGIQSEESDTTFRADFVEGKGEGTIFLLHGGPGVGKTFTAECIAEFTRRPLISLTCADIGTDERKVEENLNQWLSNAERWGAVLLIDEADVYLETRRVSDLKRNSLVSVFLRCLEYYRGILFLTTNRVGHFDDAFMSRIHVVIKYESLGEKERRQIWKNFFSKLERDRPNLLISDSAQDYAEGEQEGALCKEPWNGREIRNAFQTAIALADYRAQTEKGTKPQLRKSDLKQVFQMTQHFKKYLQDIHGGSEEKRAYNNRARFDPDDH